MDSALPDMLAISTLVASIMVNVLMPTMAPTKMLEENDFSWEEVASRVIEEGTGLCRGSHPAKRSSAAHSCCGICSIFNQKTDRCFLDLPFAKTKKGLSYGAVDGIVKKSLDSCN